MDPAQGFNLAALAWKNFSRRFQWDPVWGAGQTAAGKGISPASFCLV